MAGVETLQGALEKMLAAKVSFAEITVALSDGRRAHVLLKISAVEGADGSRSFDTNAPTNLGAAR